MSADELLAPVYQRLAPTTARDPLEVVSALRIPIEALPDAHKLLPVREDAEVVLLVGEESVILPPLPPLRTLFRGTRACPEFGGGEPPREYLALFSCVERVAADWCNLSGKPEYDEEFERLYALLRRRPDGRDDNPLFGWLRRAAKIALLARPTSEAEFDQVMRRLARSARTFRAHTTSTNYWQVALRPFVSGR